MNEVINLNLVYIKEDVYLFSVRISGGYKYIYVTRIEEVSTLHTTYSEKNNKEMSKCCTVVWFYYVGKNREYI